VVREAAEAASLPSSGVMAQVGHADSKMTMDVYAQLEQRVDRSHGESFDRLVRRAREQTAGSRRRSHKSA
jgi:citrate lyase gamma subunit